MKNKSYKYKFSLFLNEKNGYLLEEIILTKAIKESITMRDIIIITDKTQK